MTRYEQGFDAGERMAFEHAKRGIRSAHAEPTSEYAKGFVDGYTPRTLLWAAGAKPVDKLQGWYVEKDEAAA